ncbi:hypothetical protein [Streptomyces actuosus]|uniref:hypothetical protein n=1 Tax=Streptomyces actuosus TaxID=1885 RepID=UPI003F687B22
METRHLASGLPVLHDPATLMVAFDRVAGNRGSRTAGVDGLTVADVESAPGVPGFLDALRADLKSGSFRPLPVRERKIPKPGGAGKVRSLGIPSVADRTVQAALKLVLEPIFEADFLPVSYGFRPKRRAQDDADGVPLVGAADLGQGVRPGAHARVGSAPCSSGGPPCNSPW